MLQFNYKYLRASSTATISKTFDNNPLVKITPLFFKDAAVFHFFTDNGPIVALNVMISIPVDSKNFDLVTDQNGFVMIKLNSDKLATTYYIQFSYAN